MTESTRYAPRSYEELLTGRIGKLYDAKEAGDEYLFDEVLDEIGGLFGLHPEVIKVFVDAQAELSTQVNQVLHELAAEVASIEDPVTKEVIGKRKEKLIKWDYRSDMLDVVLAIMNEYQMIPFVNPIIGEMGFGELTEEPIQTKEEVAEFTPIEQPQPIPAPPPVPTAPTLPPTPPPENYPQPRGGKPIPPPQTLEGEDSTTFKPRKRIPMKKP